MSLNRVRLFTSIAMGALLTTLALLLNPLAALGSPAPSDEIEMRRYVVVLEDSVEHPGAVAEEQVEEVGGDVSLVYRHALAGYAATLPEGEVATLEEDPQVAYVVPDLQVEAFSQETPTGISRIGAPGNKGLRIDEAENLRVDADVAVIDTGIDASHPDLNVVERTLCIPPDGGPEVEECIDGLGRADNSHGTHVAGTIGALDNGQGVVGVAAGARLWSVKVLNSEGSGYMSWITAGVDWVTAHASQIEVANMSLGCGCTFKPLDEAIEASVNAGVVYVAAAGNTHKDAKSFTPANDPDVITVSALADYDGKAGGGASPTCTNYGADDHSASFSNYGTSVDVAAPGVCIYSTEPGGGYGYKSGTSMASPHVAGAAALLASRSNPEDLQDVEAIRATIEEEGSSAWTDDSGDGVKEPLLDVSDEAVFKPADQGASTEGAEVSGGGEIKATLSGSVNPGGLATTYQFEYGQTTEYGSKAPASPASAGSGSTYAPVSQEIDGLSASTIYHYRLVATNAEGTFYGADRELATSPPTVETDAASEIHANDATLHGVVNPEGVEVTHWFEIGTSTSYGRIVLAKTKSGSGSSGPGAEDIEVSAPVGILTGDRTYHYRLVVDSVVGTVQGEDQTFTTAPTEWKTAAQFPGVEVTEGDFTGVSCASANACMAFGLRSVVYGNSPYAQRWNGSSWSSETMPGQPGAGLTVPENISCSSAEWCVAVGYYSVEAGSKPLPLAEHWNGKEWSVDSLPAMPTESVDAQLRDVSCISATSCMAVGRYVTGDSVKEPFSMHWDGSKWTKKTFGPSSTSSLRLNSVSCTDSSYCIAAGYQPGSPRRALVERWDGANWSLISVPEAVDIFEARDVSCPVRDVCAMVGSQSTGGITLRWEGGAWTKAKLPAPIGTGALALTSPKAISCPDLKTCEVVGLARTDDLQRVWPVAYTWHDSEWLQRSTAEPAGEEEGSLYGSSDLLEMSCVSPSKCWAMGVFGSQSGETTGLVEAYVAPGPDSVTDAPAGITSSAATLNATVNPGGSETSYRFEYGTSKAYGSSAPTSSKSIGSGSKGVAVSQAVEGLKPATTYHFRVIAESKAGVTYGEDRAFETDAEAIAAPTVLCSAAETPCAPTNVEPSGHVFYGLVNGAGSSFLVESSVYGTVSCAHLTYGGKTSAEAGTPLPVATEGVAPSECKGPSQLSNLALSTPASTLTASGGGDGTWTVGTSASHFQVSFDVTALGTVYHCVFGTASAPLQYDYSAGLIQGKVSLARETEGKGKAFCGSSVTMNLSAFEEEMYVSEAQVTVLCSAAETPCAPTNVEPSGTIFYGLVNGGGSSFSLESSVNGTITCGHLTYGGKTSSESGTPLPVATEAVGPSECKGASSVSNVAVSTPASTLTATGGGDGTWTVGSSSSHLQVSFDVTVVGTVYHCVFGTASAPLQYDYSAGLIQGKVSLAREQPTGQGKAFCGSSVTMNLTAFEEEMYVSRL